MTDAIFFTIVERGKANRILEQAQKIGAQSGTIILGHGTSRSRFRATRLLGQRTKELLMISAEEQLASQLHEMVASSFALHKRHRGIAFTIPFSEGGWSELATPAAWNLIITIVDRGQSEACIKSARSAGAKGGTVISGRGAGIPAHYYADLAIEPQKEIILILTPAQTTDEVKRRIIADLDLQRTGGGMLFVLSVTETTGLVEESKRGVR